MDIFEHIIIPDEYKNLDRRKRLLSHLGPGIKGDICVFIRKDESFIELEDSHAINSYIQMPDDLLLGYNYIWRCFDDYPWRYQKYEDAYQCGLWDLKTGNRLLELKGMHIGTVLGAQILDDKRLITWADDFLINVWDRNTGECLKNIPVGIDKLADYTRPEPDEDEKLKSKLWGQKIDETNEASHEEILEGMSKKDAEAYIESEAQRLKKSEEQRAKFRQRMKDITENYGNVPYVKSNAFSSWSDERRKAYVDNRQELSFNLKFVLPKTDDNRDTTYASFKGSNPDSIHWETYSGNDIWDCFSELDGVNAGYSFNQKLKDGRFFVTGEEYGISDKAYVWDGGLNLTMLLSPMGHDYCLADGQKDDGAISYDEGYVKFYDY